MYYAHTLGGTVDESCWEPLFTEESDAPIEGHLNRVARLASQFAGDMVFSYQGIWAESGRIAGLWHDLGKYQEEFLAYLKVEGGGADPKKLEYYRGKVDHSLAGALHAANCLFKKGGFICDLLAYVIAGHHAGMPNGSYLFSDRFNKKLGEWVSHVPDEVLECGSFEQEWRNEAGTMRKLVESGKLEAGGGLPGFHPLILDSGGNRGLFPFGFASAMQARMLFSCLVDADYLSTEAFAKRDTFEKRPKWPSNILERMSHELEKCLEEKEKNAGDGLISGLRREIHHASLDAASKRPGIFQLNVPTGGGKTLTSLSFALRHALQNGLKRVIYVIPYTSIIDQTAREFRRVFASLSQELGHDCVLEHHSNAREEQIDEENEGRKGADKERDDGDLARLMTENWDSPLIVTTSVQFFESLFSNKPGVCRKLHRMTKAVIIFDEAQTLPATLLAPCMEAMKCLQRDYSSTLVLCTATQPALERRAQFPVGWDSSEMQSLLGEEMEERLFSGMKRVRLEHLGKLNSEELVNHVMALDVRSCLVIVNLTKHAQALFNLLKDVCLEENSLFHLSARMCPADRERVEKAVKSRLAAQEPVILVSTRVVEAGIDISFPVVYRAHAGVDSIAQAAGRCNRHGEMPDGGVTYVFDSSDFELPSCLADLRNSVMAMRDILDMEGIEHLMEPASVREFFIRYYDLCGRATHVPWDSANILEKTMVAQRGEDMFKSFSFADIASEFHIISSGQKRVMIVQNGTESESLLKELDSCQKAGIFLDRKMYQKIQRWSVQVYSNDWEVLERKRLVEFFEKNKIFVVKAADGVYDKNIGLLSLSNYNPNNLEYTV